METYSRYAINAMERERLISDMAVAAYKCTAEFPYAVRECLLPLVRSKFIATYAKIAYGKMTDQAWREADEAWDKYGYGMADGVMHDAINAYRGETEGR